MKKILLLGAVAAMALSANAFTCEHNNKVVNGSFDQGYNLWNYTDSMKAIGAEAPNPYSWEAMDNYVDKINGWGIESNQWIGVFCIYEGVDNCGDGITRAEEDESFVHFRCCNVDGWANMNLYQVVKDLTPGEEYHLTFSCAANNPQTNHDPNFGFSVAQVDVNNEGKTIAGMELMNVNLATTDLEIAQDWVKVEGYSFTAPADGQVYLNFYFANWGNKDAKVSGKWMDLDDVCVYNPNDEAGISNVTDAAAQLGVYNLNGVRVANNAAELGNAKGVYVVRTNKGAFKLAR